MQWRVSMLFVELVQLMITISPFGHLSFRDFHRGLREAAGIRLIHLSLLVHSCRFKLSPALQKL